MKDAKAARPGAALVGLRPGDQRPAGSRIVPESDKCRPAIILANVILFTYIRGQIYSTVFANGSFCECPLGDEFGSA